MDKGRRQFGNFLYLTREGKRDDMFVSGRADSIEKQRETKRNKEIMEKNRNVEKKREKGFLFLRR